MPYPVQKMQSSKVSFPQEVADQAGGSLRGRLGPVHVEEYDLADDSDDERWIEQQSAMRKREREVSTQENGGVAAVAE